MASAEHPRSQGHTVTHPLFTPLNKKPNSSLFLSPSTLNIHLLLLLLLLLSAMALLLLSLLLFPIFNTINISDGAWCVCKPELSDTMLQKTIDYACGAGADCSPIIKNGPCFSPDTVKSHCNYAANSYYQRKGQAQGSCDFSGTAILTSSDPSVNGCSYPSSASTAGTSTTTTSPGSSSTTTSPGTAGSFTPSTTGTGGVIGSLGPSTASPDYSKAGFVLQAGMSSLFFYLIIFSCLLFFRV